MIVSLLSSGIFQDVILKFGVSLVALDLKLLRDLISGCQLPFHFFENLDIYFSKLNCTKTEKRYRGLIFGKLKPQSPSKSITK